MKRLALLVPALLFLAAAPPPPKPAPLPAAQLLQLPATGETMTPSVAATSDGFTLIWTRKGSDGNAVELASYRAGAWSPVHVVASGKNVAASRASFPAVAVHGATIDTQTIDAQWVRPNGHGRAIAFARSTDGGATWSAPLSPHPAMVSEFGFASMAVTDDGVLHAVWLDGRGLEGGEEGHGDMQLRSAQLPHGKEALADPRICDCCQTGMAVAAGGPVAVYRDRSDAEVRDIALVRWEKGGWSAPVRVHDDHWTLKGCPVNGPRVAARGNEVVVAWYTAAGEQPRVLAAFSRDGGRSFGAPLRIDDGHAAGRVDVALDAGGEALVSWISQSASGSELWLRRVAPAGTGPALKIAAEGAPQAVGYPRLAVSQDHALVTWSGTGATPQVRAAFISLRGK